LPANPKVVEAGAVKVPVMLTLKKVDALLPEMAVVPLNETEPLLWLNVPLLTKFPAMFNVVEAGAIREPLTVTLFSEVVLVPDMVVVPPKITVPLPALSVPLLIRFPFTWKLLDGVRVPEIVIIPKTGVVFPDNVVVPEKVTALDVNVAVALDTKLPFRFKAFDPALKLPL